MRSSVPPGPGERTRDYPRRNGRTTPRPPGGGSSRAIAFRRPRLGAAVRLDQRAGRGPEPGPLHRIADQPADGGGELGGVRHLHGGLLGQEGAGRSPRSSPCAARTRSACRARPARGCCGRPDRPGCRRRRPRWPPGRRSASSPIVSRMTTSARGSASIEQLRPAHDAQALGTGQRLGLGEPLRLARRRG